MNAFVSNEEVFERASDFRGAVATARFRQHEWKFLAELDGRATVGEILARLGLQQAAMATFIERQIESGVIVPSFLTYDEFTLRHGAPGGSAPEANAATPGAPAAQRAPGEFAGEPTGAATEPPPTPLVFTLSGRERSGSKNGDNSS